MAKVYLQIIDTKTGVYQTGMIQEPVINGQELINALAHFGVTYSHIKWEINDIYGSIEDTTKVVLCKVVK